jgi:hypothetical protein
MHAAQPALHALHDPSTAVVATENDTVAPPRRARPARPRRLVDRLVDALLALGIGGMTGLLAHKLAGEEPLASDPEYVGHLFAELLIFGLAALIAYWLIDDIRGARNAPRDAAEGADEQ